ncbi:hypothetical protein wCauBTS_14190 [Wolbachia pipientis]
MSNIIEQNNLGDLLKYEVSNLYSRDQITVAKGQNLKLGGNVQKSVSSRIFSSTQFSICWERRCQVET